MKKPNPIHCYCIVDPKGRRLQKTVHPFGGKFPWYALYYEYLYKMENPGIRGTAQFIRWAKRQGYQCVRLECK